MIGKCVSLLIALLAPASAAISEEFGRIEADFDSEEREWFTISLKQNGQTDASATFGRGRMTTDLHIQGHPRPVFTASDVFSIDVMFIGGFVPGDKPASVDIIHLPEGMSGPIWTSEGAPAPVVLIFEALETSEPGEIGRAIGSFEAELCLKASITAEPDTSDCRLISGTFDTQVLME